MTPRKLYVACWGEIVANDFRPATIGDAEAGRRMWVSQEDYAVLAADFSQMTAWGRGLETDKRLLSEKNAALAAENERLRKAGEWQPIETIPLFVEAMFVCEGLVGVSFGFKSKNGWAINADTDKYAPTHWMPLPATPAAKEGSDAK